jgi:hypothetical protein
VNLSDASGIGREEKTQFPFADFCKLLIVCGGVAGPHGKNVAVYF